MTYSELKINTKLTFQIVLATQAIANVVKSSFGPSGLDKMMVDDIGVSFDTFYSSANS
jgi:chaperonin GroEL (HSP60 family)